MDLTEEVSRLIGQPENEQLEYKAVLPPSRSIAQMVSAFANTKGGVIILGVAKSHTGFTINGLSEDFHANSVTHKAIDLLSPKPIVQYQYITHKNKHLYVIKVEKSDGPISLEGKIYIRNSDSIVLRNPPRKEFKPSGYSRIEQLDKQLEQYRKTSTGAKSKFIDHYQSVLNIIDDLGSILYPISPSIPTNNQEGKILIRILFSSCADNFETYLSDLLYEIYLANPSTLKSSQPVTVKEVLDCVDMQEFVVYWAKKKLNKLQRGSVKNFITDNNQINDLNVLDQIAQENIEKILQIRHLYAHRNGIVDEKFLQFYPGQYKLNEEHQLTIDEFLNQFSYLSSSVDQIDKAALGKYSLATFD
jgi:hypothetical protein